MIEGVVWRRGALDAQTCRALAAALDDRPGKRLAADAGLRAALDPVTRLVGAVLPGARIVRVVGFAKSGATAWRLPWHQDRVIAVRDRAEVEGFANWTLKSGVWHVEPPLALLERMIFARLLLDPVGGASGAMCYAEGSHTLGRVPSAEAETAAARFPETSELGAAGDLLLLPMLTLHSSSPASADTPRRVLRLDFCADPLPGGLEWAERS